MMSALTRTGISAVKTSAKISSVRLVIDRSQTQDRITPPTRCHNLLQFLLPKTNPPGSECIESMGATRAVAATPIVLPPHHLVITQLLEPPTLHLTVLRLEAPLLCRLLRHLDLFMKRP